jgi:hypothetical protein
MENRKANISSTKWHLTELGARTVISWRFKFKHYLQFCIGKRIKQTV